MKKGYLYGVMYVLISLWMAHFYAQCELIKVMLHATDRDTQSIECGNLIFYFSAEPIIQHERHYKEQNSHTYVFFFPHSKVSLACAKMVAELASKQTEHYQIQLQQIQNPVEGLRLTIQFDPTYIALAYDLFDSITRQKGIVFRLHNKQLIEKLQLLQKPVLRTAWRMKGPMRVIIDCGHGGSDTGASSGTGLKEKDVCLRIGKTAADFLNWYGIESRLTRTSDEEVSLSQRTSIAHQTEADAFISIHANYASNYEACGVETFYCDVNSYDSIYSNLDEYQQKVVCVWKMAHAACSKLLAECVHRSFVESIRANGFDLADRRVKQVASQLLLGSTIPTILIEVGFLSNGKEAELLGSERYQSLIARAICSGIMRYGLLMSSEIKT